MSNIYRPAIILAAICGALAVVIGAFAAHALKQVMDGMQLQTIETAVRYQMYHSLALLAAGIIYGAYPNKSLKLATSFFGWGILCFSGSLYLLAFLSLSGVVGLSGIGIITPIGGIFFILGWLMLLSGVLKK